MTDIPSPKNASLSTEEARKLVESLDTESLQRIYMILRDEGLAWRCHWRCSTRAHGDVPTK